LSASQGYNQFPFRVFSIKKGTYCFSGSKRIHAVFSESGIGGRSLTILKYGTFPGEYGQQKPPPKKRINLRGGLLRYTYNTNGNQVVVRTEKENQFIKAMFWQISDSNILCDELKEARKLTNKG